MLDLPALSRAVSAVLDQHGVPEDQRRVEFWYGDVELNVLCWTRDQRTEWHVKVSRRFVPPYVTFHGCVTDEALAVLQIVWAQVGEHVKGEDQE